MPADLPHVVAPSVAQGPLRAPRTAEALAAAAFVGWLPMIVINAVFVRRVHVQLGAMQQLWHHLYDAGQLLGMAASSWILVRALWRLPSIARVLVGCGLVFVAQYALLGADLDSFLERQPDSEAPFQLMFAAASTLALLLSLVVGWWTARHWLLRWLGVGVGLIAMIGNHLVLELDYVGTHFILAWIAAWFIGMNLVDWLSQRSWPRGLRVALRTISVLSLLSFAIVPGPVLRSALLVARAQWRHRSSHAFGHSYTVSRSRWPSPNTRSGSSRGVACLPLHPTASRASRACRSSSC